MPAAFDLQPTLQGEHLDLRPLRPEDYDPLFQAAADPLIWEQHPEPDRGSPEGFRRYFDGAIASGGALVAVDRETGRIIGSSRYANLDVAAGEIEIGWTFLARAYWGGAYNREMKSLMLEHAFRFVERVVFVVGPSNLRSQKALEKIGAKLLRRVQRPAGDGTTSEHLVFAISRQQAASAADRAQPGA